MSLLPLVGAILSVAVMALLLYEYYQQPLLAIAMVAVGFWLLLWFCVAAYNEWRR